MKAFLLITLIFSSYAFAFDHEHKVFHQLLKSHVKYKGRQSLVDYQGFKKSEKSFQKYLSSLSAVTKQQYDQFSREQKMAFLINAYNAFTIKLILDNPKVDSIKSIGGFFSSPWKTEFFELLGEEHHLDWIEHEQLRPVFKDPRIHFAVICASMGCPSLANFAYTAKELDQQLNTMTKRFINNPEKNAYVIEQGALTLSKIFQWYEDDFEQSKEGSLVAFIFKYLDMREKEKKISYDLLKQPDKIKIDYNDYDWNLNQWVRPKEKK